MTDPDPAARPTLLTVLNELWRASYLEAAEPGRPTAPPHPWVLAAVLVLLVAGVLIAWLAISSGWPGPSTRLPAARPSPVTAPDATPVLPAPPPPPESAPPLAPPPATVIAPPPATRALPIPRLPPKPAPPPLRPPPATVIAPPPATRALPIPPPPPKPSPPLTLPPATVIAPPPATPAAPIPAPPAAVEGAAAPTVVDPVPPTAARRVQPTQPRTGNQQTDPGAIIDWLLRQKSRDDQ